MPETKAIIETIAKPLTNQIEVFFKKHQMAILISVAIVVIFIILIRCLTRNDAGQMKISAQYAKTEE